jgi:hypothetical protein
MDRTAAPSDGTVLGQPRLLLRLEGAALAIASVYVYADQGWSWLLFALLLLAPDLAMLGYVVDPRVGATVYNLMHMAAAPLALLVIGVATNEEVVEAVAVIWFVHIGLDRALGYGLKYDDAFGHTHLGRIGRSSVGC